MSVSGSGSVTVTMTPLECPTCGVVFAVPERLVQLRRDDHDSFYCPSGHSQSFRGKSVAEKRVEELEGALSRSEAERKRLEAQLKAKPKEAVPPASTSNGGSGGGKPKRILNSAYLFDCDGKTLRIGDAVVWFVRNNPGRERRQVVEALWRIAKNADSRPTLASAVYGTLKFGVGARGGRVRVTEAGTVVPVTP